MNRHQRLIEKFTLAIIAVVAIALIFGCGSRRRRVDPIDPPPPPEIPIAALHVVVRDAGTNQPITGAIVDFQPIAGDTDCITNADGYCGAQLPLLESDTGETWRVETRAKGWVSIEASGADVAFYASQDLYLYLRRPPPPCEPAWPGQLRLVDGAYVGDDGKPVLIGSVHAGDLFGQYATGDRERIRRQLRGFRAAGYSVVRVWINANDEGASNSYWSDKPAKAWGPRSTPQYEDVLTAFAQDVAAACLRLHTAAGDLIGTSRTQAEELFDALANAIQRAGPHVWALVEGINEAGGTGVGNDPAYVEALVNRIRRRHPQILYALSAYTGHENREILREWTPAWMSFVYLHPSRNGHWWDKRRHLFSISYDGEGAPIRRNCWHGEPSGPGYRVSAQDYTDELDDEAMGLLAAASVTSRCTWTYITSAGIVFDEPFEASPGYFSTPRLLAQLPPNVMRFGRLHHSGDSFRSMRVLAATNDVRIDGAQTDDGRFVYTIDGPSGRHTLQVHRSFSGVLIHPGTGQREPIERRAGDILVVEFTRGRVLVGQIR